MTMIIRVVSALMSSSNTTDQNNVLNCLISCLMKVAIKKVKKVLQKRRVDVLACNKIIYRKMTSAVFENC